MGQLFAAAALLLFSCNVLLIQVAARRLEQQIGFLVGLVGNVAFAGVLLVVGQLLGAPPLAPPRWDAIWLFVLAGVFASYLGRRWFFRSVETVGPTRASALQIMNPAFTGALGFLALGQRLGPLDLAAVAAVLLGLVLTSRVPAPPAVVARTEAVAVPPAGGTGRSQARLHGRTTALPRAEVGFALFSALSYSVGNVLRTGAVHRWNQPVLGGLLGAAAGTLAYFCIHTSPGRLWRAVATADRRGLAWWLLTGVVTVSAQVCVIAATRSIPVAIAIIISSALPVVVLPASLLLFGNRERVSAHTVAGILLMMLGVAALLLY